MGKVCASYKHFKSYDKSGVSSSASRVATAGDSSSFGLFSPEATTDAAAEDESVVASSSSALLSVRRVGLGGFNGFCTEASRGLRSVSSEYRFPSTLPRAIAMVFRKAGFGAAAPVSDSEVGEDMKFSGTGELDRLMATLALRGDRSTGF